MRAPGIDPNLANKRGETPLISAAIGSSSDVAASLLSSNATDRNARTHKVGLTALTAAVRSVEGRDVALLLIADAATDVNLAESNGESPLHLAAYFGREDIVAALLDRQEIVAHAENSKGATPLVYSVAEGHETITARLLSHLNMSQSDLNLAMQKRYDCA